MDVLGQRSAPGGLTTPALAVARSIAHAREVRGLGRVHGSIFREAARPRTQNSKTRRSGGSAYRRSRGNSYLGRHELPSNRRYFASPVLATGEVRPGKPLPGGLRCNPRRPLCSHSSPSPFDLYRPLKPRLRWAMQCLVSFADHAGRCFPSLRTFAVQAGISKSAAGRDLAELEAEGHLTRTRRPGGVYVYRIARRFLPRWAREQVSQHRDRKRKARHARRAEASSRGVPERGTEEKPDEEKPRRRRAGAQQFAKSELSFSELPDEREQVGSAAAVVAAIAVLAAVVGSEAERAGLLRARAR